MIEHLRETLRRKPLIGVVFSVAIHAALLLLLIGVHPSRPTQKRGDALIVELPNLPEPANVGTPGPKADAPLVPAPPAPAPKAPPTPPAPRARPTPPAPERPTVAAKPAVKSEPRAVPSAPQPAPVDRGDIPVAKAAPTPAPETPKADAAPPVSPPAVASPPPSPAPPAVAMAPAPDIRSLMRRGGGGGGSGLGGAGGTGTGRAGIEGEPVPLDSKDPYFGDYLERVRALIKRHWHYPCVKNGETRECEYKSGQLVIAFGILRNGQLGFVELQRSTGHPIMDDYAANAIKLASPFPAIPPPLLVNRKGTGLPIVARFNYVVETGLTNIVP